MKETNVTEKEQNPEIPHRDTPAAQNTTGENKPADKKTDKPRKQYTVGFGFGVVSIVIGFSFSAVIGLMIGIIGLLLCFTHTKSYDTSAARIICLLGIAVSAVSWILSWIIQIKY